MSFAEWLGAKGVVIWALSSVEQAEELRAYIVEQWA